MFASVFSAVEELNHPDICSAQTVADSYASEKNQNRFRVFKANYQILDTIFGAFETFNLPSVASTSGLSSRSNSSTQLKRTKSCDVAEELFDLNSVPGDLFRAIEEVNGIIDEDVDSGEPPFSFLQKMGQFSTLFNAFEEWLENHMNPPLIVED
jgi:hypothetical protein